MCVLVESHAWRLTLLIQEPRLLPSGQAGFIYRPSRYYPLALTLTRTRSLDPASHPRKLACMARTGPKSETEAKELFSVLEARLRSVSWERSYAVSLFDAGPHQCRFIVEDGIVPAICCGAPAPLGSSWCDEHLRIVFTSEGLRSQRERLRVRTQ
jgi:hypothetical protein